jgi:tRNA(Arg) A34 adenosine deaminase TadA
MPAITSVLNDHMPGADENQLLAAIELARQARTNGNHPFGALLVDGDGRVVLEAENTVVTGMDSTAHAEMNVIRAVGERDPEFLRRCTLYASTEPCAMCAAALYWRGVRRVVFALSSEGLRRITGSDPASPHLAISCREVFAHANHEVEVSGPQLEEQARAVHEGFWG